MAGVFISYRREDSGPYVWRLCELLKEAFPEDQVFVDLDAIQPGEDFLDVIESTLAKSAVVVVVIGKKWLTSVDDSGALRLKAQNDTLRHEVKSALDQSGLHVIPVLVGGAVMPRSDQLPADLTRLARRRAIELSDGRFTRDVKDLVDALSPIMTPRQALASSPPLPHRAPDSRLPPPALQAPPPSKTAPPRSRTSPWIRWAAGGAIVALLCGGALYLRSREETPAPAVAERARPALDPLGAVEGYRSASKKNDPARLASVARPADTLALELNMRALGRPQPQILAVMLPSLPRFADERRRVRYAVLAGLYASRLSAVSPEQLGHFLPPAGYARVAPDPIPYEWFLPAANVRNRDLPRSSLQAPVLVMWLEAENFFYRPLTSMAALAEPFIKLGASWRVLGPSASDGLKAMIDEAAAAGFPGEATFQSMRFYSSYATVPDAVLLSDVGDATHENVSEFFARRNVSVVRTIGDDGRLAHALINEMALRGITPFRLGESEGLVPSSYQDACRARSDGVTHSSIAIVVESESLYGSSLLRAFRADRFDSGFCVDRFEYGTFVDLAEETGPSSYLRRLAIQLRTGDEKLRRASADGRGFRAIGVIGGDVATKLRIIETLRPEFPNAIFFTTDLNSRLFDPREIGWTRNLLVASSFGLHLGESLQGGELPFRDSYQVATFLATRLAMDDARRELQLSKDAGGSVSVSQAAIDRWFTQPRIFEIGRKGAFDFSERLSARPNPPVCGGLDWVLCDEIHPDGSRLFPAPDTVVKFEIFSILVLALWLPPFVVGRSARARVWSFLARGRTPGARRMRVLGLTSLLVAVQVALPLAAAWNWEAFAAWLTEDGKPLTAIEGISTWPTEGLRLFMILLSIYFVYRVWAKLTINLEDIGRVFRVRASDLDPAALVNTANRMRTWRQRLIQMFSVRVMAPSHHLHGASDHNVPAEEIGTWERHVDQNSLAARLARTSLLVLIVLMLSNHLVTAVGDSSIVPYRGELSLVVHELLRIPSLVAMLFAVFFLVDASVLCARFARGLLRMREREDVTWPESTLKTFEDEMDIPRAHIENWIDLQFIARRTQCLNPLIYYAFAIISIWLLSRSAVFDQWTLSAAHLVPALMASVASIGCAVVLWLVAEAARDRALLSVREALTSARGRSVSDEQSMRSPTVGQLELLRVRIENLSEGAFAPLWQQPLLKAMLLPCVAMGSTVLVGFVGRVGL